MLLITLWSLYDDAIFSEILRIDNLELTRDQQLGGSFVSSEPDLYILQLLL